VPISAKGRLLGALTVFNSRNPEGFSSADIRMLGIIGVQSAQIMENARLYKEELRLRQLEGEVDAARKIQEGFLPHTIPEVRGYDIYGGSRAAKETGGDYYDFLPAGENQLVFTLGDVSGKGLPAALLMSTIQGQARLLVNRNPDPDPCAILRELNSITCQLSGPTQFATMVVGLLRTGGDEVMMANGGHNYPLIVRKNGTVEEVTESSVLIGMFDSGEFVESACRLAAGDVLAIASDGIEEAFNENEEEFGLDRFKELLCNHRDRNAADIYEEISGAVTDFRGSADQSDDITLLVIKRTEA
jgi:sigma-B regulation protein RsbU (phosphoserine phosphatase)